MTYTIGITNAFDDKVYLRVKERDRVISEIVLPSNTGLIKTALKSYAGSTVKVDNDLPKRIRGIALGQNLDRRA